VLKVSASGYRQYRARQTGGTGPLQPGRRIGEVALLVHLKAIFNESRMQQRAAAMSSSQPSSGSLG